MRGLRSPLLRACPTRGGLLAACARGGRREDLGADEFAEDGYAQVFEPHEGEVGEDHVQVVVLAAHLLTSAQSSAAFGEML